MIDKNRILEILKRELDKDGLGMLAEIISIEVEGDDIVFDIPIPHIEKLEYGGDLSDNDVGEMDRFLKNIFGNVKGRLILNRILKVVKRGYFRRLFQNVILQLRG